MEANRHGFPRVHCFALLLTNKDSDSSANRIMMVAIDLETGLVLPQVVPLKLLCPVTYDGRTA